MKNDDDDNLFGWGKHRKVQPHYNGPDYVPERDNSRLSAQTHRIFALMCDGKWRTLPDMTEATGDPPASISAQLRHLRKRRFGQHTIEKNYLGSGLYEYRLLVNRQQARSA